MAHQTKPKSFTVIYQAWDVVFHHQMKHREECGESGEMFHRLMKHVSNAWYYFLKKMILEGEIKDAKMSSFSSDFQTLIKH